MASEVEIANTALSRVGATRITALTENSVAARAVNAIYAQMRDVELRAHVWNFAIKRAQLAEDATVPAFGPSAAFTLPSDFIRLLPPDPELHSNDLDWRIEGRRILTYDTAPLDIRYVYRVTDPNEMDPIFRQALALRIARAICEPLTQSNNKLAAIDAEYKDTLREARKADALEEPPVDQPEDTWVTVRL